MGGIYQNISITAGFPCSLWNLPSMVFRAVIEIFRFRVVAQVQRLTFYLLVATLNMPSSPSFASLFYLLQGWDICYFVFFLCFYMILYIWFGAAQPASISDAVKQTGILPS